MKRKEEYNAFLESSKMVYQLYTRTHPEFEQEFGKAHILHKITVSNELKKVIPTFDPLNPPKVKATIHKQKKTSKNYEIKLPSNTPSVVTTPMAPPKPQPPKPQTPVVPPPTLPDGTPIKRGRGRPRSKPPVCRKCNSEEGTNFMYCQTCRQFIHDTCSEPSLKHLPEEYRSNWKCIECKVCEACNNDENDIDIIICDHCDRAWHTTCLKIDKPTSEDPWFCLSCTEKMNKKE